MVNILGSAFSLQGRWTQKPRHHVRPSKWAMDNGLRFLCLWDRPNPINLVTMERASGVPATKKIRASPFGSLATYIEPYGGDYSWPDQPGFEILGGLTILNRNTVGGNYYYPLVACKASPANTTNVPFNAYCNLYYPGPNGYYVSFIRANATVYREWRSDNIECSSAVGSSWHNNAIICGSAMEVAPRFISDSNSSLMQAIGGSGTGPPTASGLALKFADTNHQEEIKDYTAIFASQLSVREVLDIQQAPFGELVEDDDYEKRTFYIPRLSVPAGRTNQGLPLLGVGD